MRKIFSALIFSLIFCCCNKGKSDYKKITITNFSEKRVDTLTPYKDKSYVAFYLKVKGHVNDSIKIQRDGYFDIVLSGQIDTLINGDYYGDHKVIYIFNPYKATKGELEIEYSL